LLNKEKAPLCFAQLGDFLLFNPYKSKLLTDFQ